MSRIPCSLDEGCKMYKGLMYSWPALLAEQEELELAAGVAALMLNREQVTECYLDLTGKPLFTQS